MNLIYFLFAEKNIMPSKYYNIAEGEKEIVQAIFLKQIELYLDYVESQ